VQPEQQALHLLLWTAAQQRWARGTQTDEERAHGAGCHTRAEPRQCWESTTGVPRAGSTTPAPNAGSLQNCAGADQFSLPT
jgi:hypothetical protein